MDRSTVDSCSLSACPGPAQATFSGIVNLLIWPSPFSSVFNLNSLLPYYHQHLTILKHIPAYFKNSIFPLLHMHPGMILFFLPFTVGIQERWTILGLHRCPQVCFGPAQFNWNFLYQCFYTPPYLPHLPYTLNISLAFGTVCPFSNLRVCDTPSSICWQLSHNCFSLSFFALRVGNSYRSFLNYLFSIGMVTNNLLHTYDSINNFMLIMHKCLSPVHIFLLDFRPKYSSIDLYAGGCHRHLKLSKSEMEFVTHYSSPVVLFACACTHTHTHTHPYNSILNYSNG